jgi:hypothetical protein
MCTSVLGMHVVIWVSWPRKCSGHTTNDPHIQHDVPMHVHTFRRIGIAHASAFEWFQAWRRMRTRASRCVNIEIYTTRMRLCKHTGACHRHMRSWIADVTIPVRATISVSNSLMASLADLPARLRPCETCARPQRQRVLWRPSARVSCSSSLLLLAHMYVCAGQANLSRKDAYKASVLEMSGVCP